MTTTREIAEYVGRTFKYGGDIKATIEQLAEVNIERPTPPANATDDIEKLIFSREIDEYVKRKTFLRENMKTAYSLIWGQCTDYLRQKLEVTNDYGTFSLSQNPIDLLKAIKTINFKFEEHRYIYHSVYDVHHNFYKFRQAHKVPVLVNI